MAKPLEALIEYSHLANNKRLTVSFGVWDEKARAEKGKFPCFYKMAESQTIYARTDRREEHLFLAYSFLNDLGFLGKIHYRSKNGYEVEEPNHLEVFPGMGFISKPPTLIYARDLICGIGISFYSEKKTGRLIGKS